MLNNKKKSAVIILSVSLLLLTVVAFGVAFASTSEPESMALDNVMNYEVNENSQTYGSALEATSLDTLPDLIHTGYINDVPIFIYTTDLLAKLPKTQEQADALMAIHEVYTDIYDFDLLLNVYLSDGITVVEGVYGTADFHFLPDAVIALFVIPQYPVNENGQTYGSEGFFHRDLKPDLVLAEGTNGAIGYLYYEELNSPFGGEITNPEEALAEMERRENEDRNGRFISLYKSDGLTVIGEFWIGIGMPQLTN
jgi:hypothetical protein